MVGDVGDVGDNAHLVPGDDDDGEQKFEQEHETKQQEQLRNESVKNADPSTDATTTAGATCSSTGDGDCSVPCETVKRRSLLKAMQSMRQNNNKAFQPVRPSQNISPPSAEPASLIDQSRHMRRALDMSCHGHPPDESLYVDGDKDLGIDDNDEDEDDEEENFKLGDPLHEDTRCLGKYRNLVGKIVNLSPIQWTLMAFIIANSLILGALTFLHDNESASRKLEAVDYTFLVIFTGELVAQFFYLGIQYFKNGWLMFDAVIISVSWAFDGSEMTVMRSFRIFRIFAMISRWTSLQRLFKAIGRTMPKMGTIAAVLVLFFYAFSVFYTNLYYGLYEEGYLDVDYFGRLDLTFLTLFQVMTLDSWTAMVRQVMEVYPWAWIGFVVWVIITAFFFVNLIVAVICESLFELNTIKDKKRQRKILRHQDNVVKNQTQKLMTETQQLLEIQKEMLANQIIMEKTLLEVVELLRKNGRDAEHKTDAQAFGIRSLSSLLSSLDEPKSSGLTEEANGNDSGLTEASTVRNDSSRSLFRQAALSA